MDTLSPSPLLPLLDEAAADHVLDDAGVGQAVLECLPDRELIRGYRLWLNLRANGLEAATVTTRHDLAGLPPDILGLHVLKGFLTEMGADAKARAALFLVWEGWRSKLPRRGRRTSRKDLVNNAILNVLGVSRRTLLRDRAALTLSADERRGLDKLRLPKWAVERLGRLPQGRRQQAVRKLRTTDDIKAALDELFPPTQKGRHAKAANAVAALARDLERGLADLDGRMDEAVRVAPRHRETFGKAAPIISRLALADAGRNHQVNEPSGRLEHQPADDQLQGESAHPEGSR